MCVYQFDEEYEEEDECREHEGVCQKLSVKGIYITIVTRLYKVRCNTPETYTYVGGAFLEALLKVLTKSESMTASDGFIL